MNKVEVAISQDGATWIFKWWNGILDLIAHTVKTDVAIKAWLKIIWWNWVSLEDNCCTKWSRKGETKIGKFYATTDKKNWTGRLLSHIVTISGSNWLTNIFYLPKNRAFTMQIFW